MSPIHHQSGVTVVELGREYHSLDDATWNHGRDELLSSAEKAEPPLLVLDMSLTEYIGSAFIEVIFRAWRRIQARGGRMVLCGLQPPCAEVLQITQLDTLWDSFQDRPSAVAALQPD